MKAKMTPERRQKIDKQIKDWKENWNWGDVKFVPYLFEMVEELTNEMDQMINEYEEWIKDLEGPTPKQLKDQLEYARYGLLQVKNLRCDHSPCYATNRAIKVAEKTLDELWKMENKK